MMMVMWLIILWSIKSLNDTWMIVVVMLILGFRVRFILLHDWWRLYLSHMVVLGANADHLLLLDVLRLCCGPFQQGIRGGGELSNAFWMHEVMLCILLFIEVSLVGFGRAEVVLELEHAYLILVFWVQFSLLDLNTWLFGTIQGPYLGLLFHTGKSFTCTTLLKALILLAIIVWVDAGIIVLVDRCIISLRVHLLSLFLRE